MSDDQPMAGKKREAEERARAFVMQRQQAYQDTFNESSEFAKFVLSDLAAFCRAGASTFHADPRLHALMEGRREVWLRIQEHLNQDSETLWKTISRKGT